MLARCEAAANALISEAGIRGGSDAPRKAATDEYTVNFHMKNILAKRHLKNRAQAVAYAIRTGVVNVSAFEAA